MIQTPKKQILNFVIVLLLSGIVFALPTPHGIDGTIYELDGLTPLPNIDFQVIDLTTGENIIGKTRNDGSYSVSLDGNNGDNIMLKAWNEYNSNNRTFSLNGVMHNVNLHFNTSIPNLPPELIVNNSLNISVNTLLTYQIEASDPNNDDLTYSIITNENIIVNSTTGILTWTPTAIGTFTITLQVSDGEFNISKPLIINVFSSTQNNPPIINSTPNKIAYLFHLYKYKVQAYDPDNDKLRYFLIEKPFNMRINRKTGKIKWYPLFRHIGDNKVKIMVTDGQSMTFQEFTIRVDVPRKTFIAEENSPIEKFNSNENIIVGSTTLNQRPEKTKIFDKKVYKYMQIESHVTPTQTTKFTFKVLKNWIQKNNAQPNEIILNRFYNNKWNQINLDYSHSDELYYYYLANVPGFSYFALSLKDSREEPFIVSGPDESYILAGRVKGKLFESKLKITNKQTGYTEEISTQNNGNFYTIIKSSIGDEITIEIEKIKKNIVIEGDMKNITLQSTDNFIDGSLIGVIISALLLFIIIWRRKNETN